MVALLARFEGELQGKEIALAALKVNERSASSFDVRVFQSDRLRILLSNCRFDLFASKVDPHAALLRDSGRVKDDVQREFELVRKCQHGQMFRLTELVAQQREEIETLRRFIDEGQKRYATVGATLPFDSTANVSLCSCIEN